ncbi:S-layer homology domain-containing protein [Patescibacteria group bacterium]
MKHTFMRGIAVFALSSLLFANIANAVVTEEPSEYVDNEALAVALEGTENAEGKVDLSWTAFEGSDFLYYKVVHSQTIETPKYPDDGYIQAISDVSTTTYTHTDVPAGTNYYSLCVVVSGKERGCSTVTVEAAGTVSEETPKEEPVSDPYTDDETIQITLTGQLNDLGKADLQWTMYEGGDLKWYKVVHSQTNDAAYYPVDGYVAVHSDPAENTYTHTSVPEGTNYYRICVITDTDMRGCSNTVTLEKGYVTTDLSFKDTETHWAKLYIEDLADKGIVEGYEDGSFLPDAKVKRAEAIKMIMNNQEKECDASLFPDLDSGHWFCGVVTKAYFVGAVEGDNGKLYPDKEMSRAEAVKVLLSVQGITPPEVNTDPFTDVSKTQWYAGYVYKASVLGYIEGEDGAFDPDRPISRAELAKIVSLAWQ